MSYLIPLTKSDIISIKNDTTYLSRKTDIDMLIKPLYNNVINASINGHTQYIDNRSYSAVALQIIDPTFLTDYKTRIQAVFPDCTLSFNEINDIGGITNITITVDWSDSNVS